MGPVTLLVWDDESVQRLTGRSPRFPLTERLYFANALRYVSAALPVCQASVDELALASSENACIWADYQDSANEAREAFCARRGIQYRVIAAAQLRGFPQIQPPPPGERKKVIVTGCYDWLHSGHIRFFEEVSSYGDLYAVVGHDANIRALKGAGHPLLPQAERRYMVEAIRYVTQALVASGDGWLDALPEIERLKPHIYAVNEDGDRGGKREFCAAHGLEYLVLKRVPAGGLPKRSSTELRGY